MLLDLGIDGESFTNERTLEQSLEGLWSMELAKRLEVN